MNKRLETFDELRQRVESGEGWIQVFKKLTSFYDDALENPGRQVICPFGNHEKEPEKKRFRFFADADVTGNAICTCLPGSQNPFELLRLAGVAESRGLVAKEVRKAIDDPSNLPSTQPTIRPKVKTVKGSASLTQQELSKNRERLEKTKAGLLSIMHADAEPARLYFRNRGIPLTGDSLCSRFHPSLGYFEENEDGRWEKKASYPAIVSPMLDTEGHVVRFHRIYVTSDGKKAPVENVKTLTSAISNKPSAGIPVHSAKSNSTELNIAEGVETAHSVWLGLGGDCHVWASANAPSMRNLVIPDWVESVRIWADFDTINPITGFRAGTWAAEAYAEACCKKGLPVEIWYPDVKMLSGSPEKADWEDVFTTSNGSLKGLSLAERFGWIRAHARVDYFHKKAAA